MPVARSSHYSLLVLLVESTSSRTRPDPHRQTCPQERKYRVCCYRCSTGEKQQPLTCPFRVICTQGCLASPVVHLACTVQFGLKFGYFLPATISRACEACIALGPARHIRQWRRVSSSIYLFTPAPPRPPPPPPPAKGSSGRAVARRRVRQVQAEGDEERPV